MQDIRERYFTRDRYFTFCFLFAIVVFAAIWFIPSRYPASVRVAAIGGTMAFFGVIAMALPVLRVGPYQWISNLHFEEIRKDFPDGESQLTERQQQDLEDQRKFDLLIQNIFGPYMIGIGTFINGISGFFG